MEENTHVFIVQHEEEEVLAKLYMNLNGDDDDVDSGRDD